jgi:hypothetical protein
MLRYVTCIVFAIELVVLLKFGAYIADYSTPQFKPINSGCFGNQACQVNGAITHILLVTSITRERSASAPSFTHDRGTDVHSREHQSQ